MTLDEVLAELHSLAKPENLGGMSRFGITTHNALGTGMPPLRKLAKQIKTDRNLAQQLWATELHEARILAAMIDNPQEVTEAQAEEWVCCFNSWDLCDQVCGNLFDKTSFALQKCTEWSSRPEEFVKRAAFALMASIAIHRRDIPDADLLFFFELIEKQANDKRNFVKKAVNWALRQTGKRSAFLLGHARVCAEKIALQNYPSARWIAADALREFNQLAAPKYENPSQNSG